MIYSVNFADESFQIQREYNTKTAYSKGKVDKVFEFSPSDIEDSFLKENKSIFSYDRGHGLWIWKPYFILKVLQEINEGDYLFYCDAGTYFINKVQFLVDCMEKNKQSILGFELPLLERQFTKKETFSLMGYSELENNQILASYILLKKDTYSLKFIKEWLEYMSDERISSPNQLCKNIPEFEDYISHREDQSVFSILYHKKGLQPFRDPSQKGDRPFEYMWIPSFSNQWVEWTYNPHSFKNSKYPRILVINRKSEPLKFKKKEFVINIINRIGLYNEKLYKELFYKRGYNPPL